MLWTAPPRHESAIDVGAVKTPYDSEEPEQCKRRRRSVSISRSPFSRFMVSMRMAMLFFAASSSVVTYVSAGPRFDSLRRHQKISQLFQSISCILEEQIYCKR